MTDPFRFPRTPHLAWLAQGTPRDDKVLDAADARELLEHPVVIEEKVDGANLGFSIDDRGTVRAQSRGSYLRLDSLPAQFRTLPQRLNPHREALGRALGSSLILFGE